MVKRLKILIHIAATVLLAALVTACGGSGSNNTATIFSTTNPEVFYSHSLVIKGVEVYAMGYNGNGQLGNGDDKGGEKLSPVQVIDDTGALTGMTGVAIGANHSLAFDNSGVRAWGNNGSGQLGNEDAEGKSSSKAVKVRKTDGTELSGVTAVAAGAAHSLALVGGVPVGGDVWVWGSGSNTAGKIDGLSGVTKIAAGSYHSLALAGGKIYAWGSNSKGQLGVDPVVTPSSVTAVEVVLPGNTSKVVEIAAGGSHSLALTEDGRVWAWGLNYFGQLGVPLEDETKKFRDTPAVVPGVENIEMISAGLDHSLAVEKNSNGLVWAWGYNGFGQLGRGTVNINVPDPAANPTAQRFNLGKKINQLYSVGHQNLAVTSDGVYAWGDNTFGQLGNGSKTSTSTPGLVAAF